MERALQSKGGWGLQPQGIIRRSIVMAHQAGAVQHHPLLEDGIERYGKQPRHLGGLGA